MRIKFAILVSCLIGAATVALTGSFPARAAALSPASASGAHSPAAVNSAAVHPAYSANVTVTVRCGKFVGKINHGGLGGLLDRAYLQVEGKVSSSCSSTTYLEVRYTTGVEAFPGTIIRAAGARRTVSVDWEVHSIEGTYGNIGVRVGTTDGMPKGSIHWGAWKDV